MDINSDAIVATLDQATETLRLARERITQLEALIAKIFADGNGYDLDICYDLSSSGYIDGRYDFTPAEYELVNSIRRGAGLEPR